MPGSNSVPDHFQLISSFFIFFVKTWVTWTYAANSWTGTCGFSISKGISPPPPLHNYQAWRYPSFFLRTWGWWRVGLLDHFYIDLSSHFIEISSETSPLGLTLGLFSIWLSQYSVKKLSTIHGDTLPAITKDYHVSMIPTS